MQAYHCRVFFTAADTIAAAAAAAGIAALPAPNLTD
jgi:hypothetical protein